MIAFEGLDGAGKSTQIQRLVDTLHRRGRETHVFRLTANALFKQQCRGLNEHSLLDATTAALMKAAELTGRLECAVNPCVDRGGIVIWDKYVAGSLAADSVRGVPDAHLAAIRAVLPEPDLTLFLDARPDEALRRKRQNGGPRMMESGLDQRLGLPLREVFAMWTSGALPPDVIDAHFLAFQSQLRDAYARFLPIERTLRIDADSTIDHIADRIRDAVFHTLAIDDGDRPIVGAAQRTAL